MISASTMSQELCQILEIKTLNKIDIVKYVNASVIIVNSQLVRISF